MDTTPSADYMLGVGDIPRCDVCLLPGPEYTWFTKDFTFKYAGYPEYVDDGAWGLCPTCHELTIARAIDPLIQRAMAGALNVTGQLDLGWCTIMMDHFLTHVTGEWIIDTDSPIGHWPGK